MRFSQLSTTAQAYILGVYVLGLAVVAGEWWLIGSSEAPTAASWPWGLFVLLTLAATVAHSFPVSTPGRQAYHVSLPFFVAAIILLPPLQVAALLAIVHLAEWLRRRRSWFAQVFNLATYVLTATAAQAIYRLLSAGLPDSPMLLDQPYPLLGGLAAILAFALVNRGLVSLAIWLGNGIPPRQQHMFEPESLLTDGILLAMGLPLAYLWLLAPWLVALGGAPLLLIYRALDVPNIRAQRRQDALTQLFTAPYLTEACSRELSRAHRFGRPLAMLVVDIDHLGDLNARYGYQAGDAIIQGTARLLDRMTREYDVLARVVGGEFAILLPEIDAAGAGVVAQRIQDAIATRRYEVASSVEPIRTSASIGVAVCQGNGHTAEQLFAAAEAALAQAKRAGGNHLCFGSIAASAATPPEPAPASAPPTAPAPAAQPPVEATSAPPQAAQALGHAAPAAASGWGTLLSAHPERAPLLLSLAMAAATAALVLALAPPLPPLDLSTVLLFLAFLLLAESRSMELFDRSSYSISVVPILAAGMLLGIPGAVALAPVPALLRGLRRHSTWYKVVFNASTYVVASTAATSVYHLFGWPLAPSNLLSLLLPATLAGLAFYLHTVLVATGMATEVRARPLQLWAEHFRWLWPQYVVLSGMGLLLAIAYHEYGVLGAAAFAVPPLMMRFVAKQYLDRTLDNVRQLRALNEQLGASEAQLRALYEAMACGILVRDRAGAVVRANAAAEEMLGLPFDRMRGQTPASLWRAAREDGSDLPDAEHPSSVALQTRRPVRHSTLRVTRPDGERRWHQVDAVPMLGEDGEPVQVVSSFIDITKRKQAEEALERQALYDALTGLPNRTLLHDRLRQVLLAAQRNTRSLALLVMDLDGFKEVNDTLGHHCGDALLPQVGQRLREALRASDTVARLGGDEFAVLLPTADAEGALLAARKLLRALEPSFVVEGQSLEVRMSIGIALSPDHGADAETLLRRADIAMYAAKRAQSGYALYTFDQDEHTPSRLALMGELRQAIDQDGLVLHYQPKVNLKTGQVVGVEALVRWPHPQHGLVPPDQFIPLAEHTGLIRPLARWVLDTALRQCQVWRSAGLDLPVAVNLSMRNLHDPQLPDMIAALLAAWAVPPANLELEITESAVMADPTRAMQVLTRLREMGLQIAVDDFGTGYSSLGYLKRLPVDELKIDKSFVLQMAQDENDAAIVRSTIGLGHDLGLAVVAEGVEDQASWNLLASLGCDSVQGYHMSRPLAPDDLQQWLGGWTRRLEQAGTAAWEERAGAAA
ncbi:MAG: diguanylate cyclase [Chloroflexi bacterium]|nr:diguanylate cyclase [Chloroflexota bacterium]